MHMQSLLHSILARALVLTSSLLASLQLIQVPSANRQATLVLVHAGAELLDVSRARARRLHLCGALVLLCEFGVLGRSLGGCGGRAAAEEAADGVADGGSDCDTTVLRKSG